MKKILSIFFVFTFAFLVLSGCQQSQKSSDARLFVVEMEQGKTLNYKMISERDIVVRFDGSDSSKKGKNTDWEMGEKLEIDAQLTLKEVDSMGLYVVQATYPKVRVSRKGRSRDAAKDAVEYLQGKSVTFKMTPAGVIVEPENLVELIQSLGDKAFGSGKSADIKSQDMVGDFLELQWFMFDPVAKITDPFAGVEPGQEWESFVSVPAPLLLNATRKATYSLTEVIEENQQEKAVIDVNYVLADQTLDTPRIYSGRAFRQKGFFGVLRCKPLSLEGSGKVVYNLDQGILEKSTQQYTFETTAVLFMPLPGTENSRMKIDQKFSIELVDK